MHRRLGTLIKFDIQILIMLNELAIFIQFHLLKLLR
jgi:hypothetical protein